MGKEHLYFDPRTKLLILLLNSIFVFGGVGGDAPIMYFFRNALVIIPFVYLFLFGKRRIVIYATLFYVAFYVAQMTIFPYLQGMANYIVLCCIGFFVRIVPNIMAAYLVVGTTKVSDLIAAMKKLHISDKIIIPMTVIIRFFPVIMDEGRKISDAMRMRDLRFGGRNMTKILEYRIIPLIICSVKAGEELSAAALARGLGSPVNRTDLSNIGFKVGDYFIMAMTVAMIAVSLMSLS